MDDLFELTHTPNRMLGHLEPQASLGECAQDGGIYVNGVWLPRLVAEQLRRRGEPLAAYTPGELQAADLSSVIDCTVIHDPDEPDFMDDLKPRTAAECAMDDGDDDVPPEPWRMSDEHIKAPHHVDAPSSPWQSFSEQLSCREHRSLTMFDCDIK